MSKRDGTVAQAEIQNAKEQDLLNGETGNVKKYKQEDEGKRGVVENELDTKRGDNERFQGLNAPNYALNNDSKLLLPAQN